MQPIQAFKITDQDAMRLFRVVKDTIGKSSANGNEAEALHDALDLAVIVPQKDIPQDVITMNSTITVEDVGSCQKHTFTLVYPEAADAPANRVSVLSPAGNALLGAKIGDSISVVAPASVRTMRVISISFQPERSGHYDL